MFQCVYQAAQSTQAARSAVTLLQMRLNLSEDSLLTMGNLIVMRADTRYALAKIKDHIDSVIRAANARRSTVICGRSGQIL